MPIANANGKKFTFPEGTTPEQMGQAIDEYFSHHQLAQSGQADNSARNAVLADAKKTLADNAWANDYSNNTPGFEQLMAGTGKAFVDAGRGVNQLANNVDIAIQDQAKNGSAYNPLTYAAKAGNAVNNMLGVDPVAQQQQLNADELSARATDKALMDTTAGAAGNLFGNTAIIAPTMLLPGVNTYTGAGTIGAIQGAMQPTINGESKLKNAAIGAGAGLAGQGIGMLAGKAIGALAGWAQSRNVAQTLAADGLTPELRAQAVAELSGAGIDAANISDDEIKALILDANRTVVTPNEKEFGVNLTRGQRAKDPLQLNAEDSMRAGAKGEKARAIYLQGVDQQQKQISSAASGLQSELGGGAAPVMDNFEPANNIMGAIRDKSAAALESVGLEYDKVGDAGLAAPGFKDLLSSTRGAISSSEFPKEPVLAPATNAAIDMIDGHISKLNAVEKKYGPTERLNKGLGFSQVANEDTARNITNIKMIDTIRKSLNGYRKAAANPTDERNVIAMIKTFDNKLDSVVSNNLLQGDEAAISQLKKARALSADYFNTFTEQPDITRTGNVIPDRPGKLIENIIASNPTAEEVANSIYTMQSFSNRASAKFSDRFKSVLGEDSPEWQSIKQAGFRNLLQTRKGISGQELSPPQINTAIKKAFENKSLMDSLYTAQEQAKIRRFGALMNSVEPSLGALKSRVTPSGKAIEISPELQDLGKELLGYSNPILKMTKAGAAYIDQNVTQPQNAREAFRPLSGLLKDIVRPENAPNYAKQIAPITQAGARIYNQQGNN